MARYGKKNSTKFKLTKELVILVVALVAIIAVTVILSIPSKEEKIIAEYNTAIEEFNTQNSTSHSTLTSDEIVYVKADLADIEKALNSKGTDEEPEYTYVLYGTLKAATVVQYFNYINEEAKQHEIETIYFYSSSFVDGQEDKDDEEFLAKVDSYENVLNANVLEGVDEVDLLKTASFYVYKNGELVFNSNTYVEEGIYNWVQILSEAFSK